MSYKLAFGLAAASIAVLCIIGAIFGLAVVAGVVFAVCGVTLLGIMIKVVADTIRDMEEF